MMSNGNSQNQVKLKASIEEIVGSLLNRITVVSGPKEVVKNMCTLIEKTKNLLESRQKWDTALMRICGDIERQIDTVSKIRGAHKEITSSTEEEILQQNFSIEEEKNEQIWTVLVENFEKHLNALSVDTSIISTTAQQDESVFSEETTTDEDNEPSNRKFRLRRRRLTTTDEDNKPSNRKGLLAFVDYAKEELRKCRDKLSRQQRIWLLSLGIFPLASKPQQMKRRLLVQYWWIGLGQEPSELAGHEVPYNASEGEHPNTRVEHLAENFFYYLVQEGILQPIRRKHSQVINNCTIHPTIHRRLRAIFLWEQVRLRYKRAIAKRKAINWPFDERKDTFIFDERKDINGCFVRDGRHCVRVLLNVNQKYLNSTNIASKDVLGDNKALQVVHFGRWQCTNSKTHIEVDDTDFLKKLGENLIFLSLRGISMIDQLPESIGKLQNLRILDLRACHNLAQLPHKPQSRSLWLKSRKESWFINLTHLDISECYALNHMPQWICELSNLEVLKGYVVGSEGKKRDFCQLRDLSKLTKLRKLSIRIVNPLDPEEARGLESLDWLSILTVSWSNNEDNNDKDKVWTISFPKNLEKLDIRCYPEADAPKQLNPSVLPKLKRLYIRGGQLASIADGNGSYWTVEILRLRILNFLKIEWLELGRTFPKLKHVEYKWCPKLKKFPNYRSAWNVENDGPIPQFYAEPKPIWIKIRSNFMVPLKEKKQKIMLEVTCTDFTDRPPGLNLVAVLDVSKGMEDDNKLEKLKTAMLFVINKLRSDHDRLAIVTFSDEVKTIWELQYITESSLSKLQNLVTGLRAVSPLEPSIILDNVEVASNILKHNKMSGKDCIIFISGGALLTKWIVEYSGECKKVMGDCLRSVAAYTFELQNSKLDYLEEVASESMGGTHSEVRNSENLIKAVSMCLAGLLTVAVQDLTLTLRHAPFLSNIKHVSAGDYDQQFIQDIDGNSATIKFGDLYRGEVRKVLVELSLKDGKTHNKSGPWPPNTSDNHGPAHLLNYESGEGYARVLRVEYSYSSYGELRSPPPVDVWVRRKRRVSAYQPRFLPEVFAEEVRSETVRMISEMKGHDYTEIMFKKKMYAAKYFLEDKKIKLNEKNELLELLTAEIEELLKVKGATRPVPLPNVPGVFVGDFPDFLLRFLNSFLISHNRQRAAARGDDIEKFLSFATPDMLSFLREAEEFSANHRLLPTPIDDEAQ